MELNEILEHAKANQEFEKNFNAMWTMVELFMKIGFTKKQAMNFMTEVSNIMFKAQFHELEPDSDEETNFLYEEVIKIADKNGIEVDEMLMVLTLILEIFNF